MDMGLGGALILLALMTQMLLRSNCNATRPYADALSANERILIALCAPLLPKCTSLTEALKWQLKANEEAIVNAVAEYAMMLNRRLERGLAEKIARCLLDAAKRNDLDPCLLAAIVARESSFHPEARSSSGAIGLAQLMPQTVSMLGVANPHDVAQNLDGAARYIAMLMSRWRGRDDFVEMALASYRLGPRIIELRCGIPDVAGIALYLNDVLSHYSTLRSMIADADQRYGSGEGEGR